MKKHITNCYCVAILFIGLLQTTFAVALDNKAQQDFPVSNAVVYLPLGSSHDTTALFSFKNNTDNDVTLVKVSSASVKSIVLIPSSKWSLAAHHTLMLEQDKQYLQLNGLKTTLTTGDELELIVSLSNGKQVRIIARAVSAYDQIHGH